MTRPKVPPGALMSPPDAWRVAEAGLDLRLGVLEDRVRDLRIELKDHGLRLRDVAFRVNGGPP